MLYKFFSGSVVHDLFMKKQKELEPTAQTTKFMSDQLQSATFDLEAADDLAQSVTTAISEKRTEGNQK
ncbi:hypothetical protein JOQ06_023823 [Pogonophryne albipinna]|uniref:Uncharacterized protein n=1 Tax=Pogonophryne albipinna TaxID=1090488 RepID=A0AAD6BNK9_9TELE|nr:hypothetical protein JOQ06_023823 [Pogonophryne albipinna]